MKLIFFSHANRIKRVGIIDDCDDREWKISPRRGDGNVADILMAYLALLGMEDKSPKRGRKQITNWLHRVHTFEWKIAPHLGDEYTKSKYKRI